MGFDWESILGADGGDIADAWDDAVDYAMRQDELYSDNMERSDSVNKQNPPYSSKPKYSGVWKKTNKEISFNRVWGTYSFSDEECELLLDCKVITITTNKKSDGSPMTLSGELAEQTFENNGKTHHFIGFKAIFK